MAPRVAAARSTPTPGSEYPKWICFKRVPPGPFAVSENDAATLAGTSVAAIWVSNPISTTLSGPCQRLLHSA